MTKSYLRMRIVAYGCGGLRVYNGREAERSQLNYTQEAKRVNEKEGKAIKSQLPPSVTGFL